MSERELFTLGLLAARERERQRQRERERWSQCSLHALVGLLAEREREEGGREGGSERQRESVCVRESALFTCISKSPC